MTRLPHAPLLKQLSLRPYQRRAIRDMRRYLAAHRAGTTAGAALIHMPTGSGKTGIIASLARCLPPKEVGCALLLTPRVALRKQLALDVRERFFSALETRPDKALPKEIVPLVGRDLAGIVAAIPAETARQATFFRNRIFVATIQMLDSIRKASERPEENRTAGERRKAELFEGLRQHLTVLMVDEGHYEPARSWGRSIRSFPVPKILFTATPYRNDLKAFDIDLAHWSLYTYEEAVEDCFLRDVEVKPYRHTDDPNIFIEDVLAFYDRQLADSGARVIIRCDTRSSIRQMARVLRNRERRFVAIHEEFADRAGPPWERRTVPDREKDPEYYGDDGPIYWIHQFKLLEGIDDNRFQLLALFEPLVNLRSFVQQVGRIVRNPEHPHAATAYVLDHSDGRQRQQWKSFLRFEDGLRGYYSDHYSTTKGYRTGGAGNGYHPLEGIGQNFVRRFFEKVRDAHPDPAYIDRTFRERFDFDRVRPSDELRLPLSVNLFVKKERFRLAAFLSVIEQALEEEDRVFRRYGTFERRTQIYIYFTLKNAPFLSSSYFLECNPGVIVIHELDGFVAFYDSGGSVPVGLAREVAGSPVPPRVLRRVFRDHEESKLVQVSLKNSNLGHRAIRWRAFGAAALRDTVPALDDYGQIVSTATGYSAEVLPPPGGVGASSLEFRRRYVGFGRARVNETSERCDLDTYLAWVEALADQLEDGRPSLTTFERFAKEEVDVKDPTPRNVLLDIFEVQDDYLTIGNEELGIERGMPMVLEDRCQDVVTTVLAGKRGRDQTRRTFTVTANDHPCEVAIEYDRQRRRYKLHSRDLDSRYYRARGGHEALVAYLNREQSFRVLPRSENAIYVDGSFYRPALDFGTDFDRDAYHVGKILHPVPELRTISSEKGKKKYPADNAWQADESDWDPDSIFGLISRLGAGARELEAEIGNPDLVVCDDPGTEVADFILADTDDRRIVLIHAKALYNDPDEDEPEKDRFSPYSASKLADVCAQAVKNIGYLSMFNEFLPRNLPRWTEPWKASGVAYEVASRVVRPVGWANGSGGKPQALWQRIRSLITHPLTRREVWLVLGRMLSKTALEEELAKEPPTAEAVQAVMQLQSTMATVGSIDAKLRVFCSP